MDFTCSASHTDERQRFRQENEDEAGWGSATFVELSDFLYTLSDKENES